MRRRRGTADRRKLVGDIASTLGTKILLFPLTLISSVIVARALQPHGKGMYTTVSTFVDLVAVIGSFGIGKAAIYYIARAQRGADSVRRTTLWLSLWDGLLLSIALGVAAIFFLPGWFRGIPTSAFLLAAPVVLLTQLRSAGEGFLRGDQRNHLFNLISLAYALVFLAAVVVPWRFSSLSPNLTIAARTIAAAGAVALAFAFLGRTRSGLRRTPSGRFNRDMSRRLLAYGVPYAAISLLQTMNYRLDILLVQGFRGSSQVGVYSIAGGIGDLLWYLPAAVGFVVFPRVAASRSKGADDEVSTLTRWTLALTALAALFIAVFAEPLIRLMYGAVYLGAATPLRILLLGIVANAWYQVLGSHLLGQGRLGRVAVATAVGLSSNVALNVILIPPFGIRGAAASSTVSYTLTGLLTLFFFTRSTKISPLKLLFPSPSEFARQGRALLGSARSS